MGKPTIKKRPCADNYLTLAALPESRCAVPEYLLTDTIAAVPNCPLMFVGVTKELKLIEFEMKVNAQEPMQQRVLVDISGHEVTLGGLSLKVSPNGAFIALGKNACLLTCS